MKTNWSISRMCGYLDQKHLEEFEPVACEETNLSHQRIRELALQKLGEQGAREKEKPMKRTLYKTLLVAALVAALTITAVAAFGGLEFFVSLFGESARHVEDQIQIPAGAVAGNEQYQLQVESLLTDGYTTSMVVSVSSVDGKPLNLSSDHLFWVESDTPLVTSSWSEMWEFSTPNKGYFHLEATSNQRFDQADLTVHLQEETAPLSVAVTAENSLGVIRLEVPEQDFAGEAYRTKELQIASMGFLAIGEETQQKGGLPAQEIQIVLKDGTVEILTDNMSFDGSPDDEETIGGGGGVVIVDSWMEAPLVIMTTGQRNPENQMVTTGSFSRILNLGDVKAVVIDGKEYPVAL